MTPVYEKGEIKVVWIGNDLSRIYSKMFEDLDQAKKFTESKKDYVIFALIKQQNMQDFEWELLPYGKHKLYKLALRFYRKYGLNLIKMLKL